MISECDYVAPDPIDVQCTRCGLIVPTREAQKDIFGQSLCWDCATMHEETEEE